MKEIEKNIENDQIVRSFFKFQYSVFDKLACRNRQNSYGSFNYISNKSYFKNMIKTLFLKYESEKYENDWSKAYNNPKV